MNETMNVKEVADYLHVHTDTIYSMVRKKELPHFRVRSRIFFEKNTIDRWIMNQSTMNAV
ncbi:helix-turn-helix domain-containing protein [Salicibibacter halophilus]